MLAKLLRSESMASLVDQGVVSGGNFLTTLVLARILVPGQYGIFALLYLALIAINTCHSSLVVYPLTLKGAEAPKTVGTLLYAALAHSTLLAVPLSMVLLIVTVMLHQWHLWPILALAMVSWQLQETTRRALLSVLRFRAAILPDMLCYVGQGCLLALFRPHSLTVVFVLVTVTSLLAAAWQLTLAVQGTTIAGGLRSAVQVHGIYAWQLGRFVLAGNALNMLTLQIPSWTLAFAFAPTAVAGYQCLLNLVGVANPIIFSINSMLIPTIAREASRGYRVARQTAITYGIRFGLLLIPAFLALLIAPHSIMRLVYGSASPYLPLAWLLRIFVVAFVIQYLATVAGAYEGGMSRPKTYMWVQMMGTGFLLAIGTLLIYRFGIEGAVVAMLLASLVRLIAFLVLSHFADKSLSQTLRPLDESFAEQA